jgi:hypothetical protein
MKNIFPFRNGGYAFPFLYRYPITRKSHAEVRAKLAAMDASAQANSETEEPVRTI